MTTKYVLDTSLIARDTLGSNVGTVLALSVKGKLKNKQKLNVMSVTPVGRGGTGLAQRRSI